MMTPEEYRRIRNAQWEIIKRANEAIDKARDEAEKYPMPDNMRPANADDIKPDAIIWHERPDEHGGPYWHIVEEVLKPADDFKAYISDGSRYGLHGAFVFDESKANSFACPECAGVGWFCGLNDDQICQSLSCQEDVEGQTPNDICCEHGICFLCQGHKRVQMAVTVDIVTDRQLTGPEAAGLLNSLNAYTADKDLSLEAKLQCMQAGRISLSAQADERKVIKLIPLKGGADDAEEDKKENPEV